MNENVRIVRVVPGGVLSPKQQKPQLPPARILFDPPNQGFVIPSSYADPAWRLRLPVNPESG